MFLNRPEDMAAKWILESGIQNVSNDPKTNGGFNGWFDVVPESYPFIYSEITGYGISSLIYLKKIHKSEIFSERATAAAKWLINNAITPEGGVLAKYYYAGNNADERYRFENQNVFAFDAGVVLYGLCNAAFENKDEKIKSSCHKVADFLVSNMLKRNGELHAVWDVKRNEPFNDENKWSMRSGSYHTKIAMGLITMHELTGEESYRRAAHRICESALKFQQPDGRFVTHNKSTHMHPHCYSAEGLLYAGNKLDRKDFIESAARAVNWIMRSQKENGGIPFLFENEFVPHERTDVLAQTLRLASIFKQKNMLAAGSGSIEKLRKRLLEFQVKEGPQAGGIKFGSDFDGTAKGHLNSWCTMFSMQALEMNTRYKLGKKIDLEIVV